MLVYAAPGVPGGAHGVVLYEVGDADVDEVKAEPRRSVMTAGFSAPTSSSRTVRLSDLALVGTDANVPCPTCAGRAHPLRGEILAAGHHHMTSGGRVTGMTVTMSSRPL